VEIANRSLSDDIEIDTDYYGAVKIFIDAPMLNVLSINKLKQSILF